MKDDDVLDLYSKKLDGSPIVGGHAYAAGMEIHENNLMEFREKVCQTLLKLNPDFSFDKIVHYADSRIVTGEINNNLYESLLSLAPFGASNPEPIFWVKNVAVEEQKFLSDGKHLKLILGDPKFRFKKQSAILWHKAENYKEDYVGKKLDILFTFGKETRGFGAKFYLSVVDLKFSD